MSVRDLIAPHLFMVLLCFSTCLIKGTLAASKFCQSRMTILYPFIISDSKVCARKNLRGKLYFCSLFQRAQPIVVGRGGKGVCHSTAAQNLTEENAEALLSHTLSPGPHQCTFRSETASSLLLLPLGLCFSLLLLAPTCSLLCPLGVFVPPWSSPSATQAFCSHPWNQTDLIAVFSPLRSISCLVRLFYFL